MKHLFYGLVLLCLTACAKMPYYHTPPTSYYTTSDLEAHNMRTGAVAFKIRNSTLVTAVGFHNGWAVIRAHGGKYYIEDALSIVDYAPPINQSTPSGAPIYDGQGLYTGPRGGQYYINGNGNKTYVTPQSTIDNQPVQTGPRGGQYYINGSGRKTYIKK